jgi:hypothetical protein
MVESQDRIRLAAFIQDIRALIAYPLGLPVILCEMLVQSDSDHVKKHVSKLYWVELRTNFNQYPNLPKSPEQDFAEITQSLNRIVSRLAFHKMRIHASTVFVDDMSDQLKVISAGYTTSQPSSSTPDGVRSNDTEAEETVWLNKLETMYQSLGERFAHLKAEQRALLLEITCNQKIAQSQLEIVYNLVAEQDNKENMEMAKLQTQESFAMRTIAVMSIFFLPGTFVSSFFSMGMSNWGAPKGSPVVSPRF